MQASEVGGRGQWLSGRMLYLNSKGRKCKPQRWGAQWLSGRMLDSRPRGPGLSLTSVNALCP